MRGRPDGSSAVIVRKRFRDALENSPAKIELEVPAEQYLFGPSYYRLEAVFRTKGDAAAKETRQYAYTNPVYVRPIHTPICVASDLTPLEVSGAEPKAGLSLRLNLDPKTISVIQVRATIDSKPGVRTGVQAVLFDSANEPIRAGEMLGRQAKRDSGLRTVDGLIETAGLKPGRYRLAIMASNLGEGVGRVQAQAVFVTWAK